MPRAVRAPHGDIVHAPRGPGSGVVVDLVAQLLADGGRQSAGEGAYVAPGLIEQGLAHDGQRPPAAPLYAPCGDGHDLMGAGGGGIHPLDAILPEEQGVSQMGDGPGEYAVAAAPRGEAVGGQAHEAVPVLEVAQFAGVDLVDRLAVHQAVLAAPHPVVALGHEVHVRHGALYRQTALLGQAALAHDAHHHQIVLPGGVDHVGAVHALHAAGESLDCHAVVLLEAAVDPRPGDLQIRGGNGHPHPAVGAELLEDGHLCVAGVHPHIAVGGVRRSRLGDGVVSVGLAVPVAQRHGHGAVHGHGVLHAAVVGEILGVEILLVRPDEQVGAHADELLRAVGRQPQIHGIVVIYRIGPLDHGHRVFGDQPGRGRQLPHHPARAACGQHREVLRRHVLLFVPLALPDLQAVVISTEDVEHLHPARQVSQLVQ